MKIYVVTRSLIAHNGAQLQLPLQCRDSEALAREFVESVNRDVAGIMGVPTVMSGRQGPPVGHILTTLGVIGITHGVTELELSGSNLLISEPRLVIPRG